MSLTASLNTALTGLQVNQNLMRLVSSNIANVSTEGYTVKKAELSAIYLNDIGGGVQIEDIRRVVDDYLIKQINGQVSTVASAEGLNEFYTRLQDLFGSPADNNSIAGMMNTLQTALEKLSVDPQQSVSQFTAVTSAIDVATELNTLSSTIQEFREEVDRQIGDGVTKINQALDRLDQLNDDIIRNLTLGNPVGDLLDKRDLELKNLAEQVDIKWFIRPNGGVSVMTQSNYSLLDDDPHYLSFTSPTGVSKLTTYPGGFSAIAVESSSPDITNYISGGRIDAMLQMRDEILPGLQDQLDQMAAMMAEEINRAHNSAMPIPSLTRIVGNTGFESADLLDPTNPASVALNAYTDPTTGLTEYGSLQFAIMDSSGSAVGDALRVNLDEFKAQMEAYVSGYTGSPYTYQVTIGDVINMINGAYAATPPTGISTPPTPVGWPGGVPWPPSPALVMPSTGSDIAGLYNLSGASLGGGFSGGEFARMVNGNLEIRMPDNSDYGIAIDDTNSTFAEAGETRASTFNYLLHLNDLYVIDEDAASAALDIHVREDIAADPSKIGRGYLSSALRDPLDPTTEEWYIGRGDGAGATAMANIFTDQYIFAAQGKLPAANQTLTEYAAAIIQLNARGAADAETAVTFQTNLKTELENRSGEVSGVNVDEELAKLISIQNAYSASARIVTTVNQMYEDLLGIIR